MSSVVTEAPTAVANSSQQLQPFVSKARTLFTLPAVAARVLELAEQPRVDLKALRECIEADPALVAKVLKVVNSSMFGLCRQVKDLSQALALLGVKPLKMLILGFSLPTPGSYPGDARWLSLYWKQAAIKAVAGRELCTKLQLNFSDEAFLAGLLQDLGQLVLLQELGEPYCNFLEHVSSQVWRIRELEHQAVDFDHAQLSAHLLEQWHLPDPIVQAVRSDVTPEAIAALPAENQPLVKVLHLADLLSRFLVWPQRELLELTLDRANAYFKLNYPTIQEVVGVLQGRVQELAKLFSFDLGSQYSYQDLLRQAHSQLADVAMVASFELLSATPEETLLATVGELRQTAQQACLSSNSRVTPPTHAVAINSRLSAAVNNAAASTPAIKQERTTDPLPQSLASHPKLLTQTTNLLSECRELRCPLTLAIVQWEDKPQIKQQATSEWLLQVASILKNDWAEPGELVMLGLGIWGLLWPGMDRSDALRLTRGMVQQVPKTISLPDGKPLILYAGVATVSLPSRTFPALDLTSAAARCLSSALLCGSSCVKSFEL
ncbi:MAG: HDOD domain-containing protein [Planctomycetaceae bacterium]